MPILLFLSNELCDPHVQRKLRVPLTFISFAIMPMHMYRGLHKHTSSFLVPHSRRQTQDVVYGALFVLADADYHIRTLDGYHLCSMSTLRRNHTLDHQHRTTHHATPIGFRSVDELARLLYTERDPVEVHVYVGNPDHPTIAQCLQPRKRRFITHGVDKHPLTHLLREVLHEDSI